MRFKVYVDHLKGVLLDVYLADSTTTAEMLWPSRWEIEEEIAPLVPDPKSWQDENLDEKYFWINTGPWKDRFGMDYLAIAASSHDMCKAFVAVYTDRQYVNIKDARQSQMLDALIATAQPTANPLFPGSGPMTVDKKNQILLQQTTEYERHLKGMEQPV